MAVPLDRQYTSDHAWLAIEGGVARVGLTDHAPALGSTVFYVEVPRVGDIVRAGQACGEVESAKATSAVVAPANGQVTAVNDDLDEVPERVSSDPYGTGWLFVMRLTGEPSVLDAAAYELTVSSR